MDIKRCANYFRGVPAITETCWRHVGDKSDDVSSGAPSKTCLVKTFPTKSTRREGRPRRVGSWFMMCDFFVKNDERAVARLKYLIHT